MLRIGRRRLLVLAIFSWLSSWLAPAKAKTHSFINVAEFRDFVMATFRRQPGVDNVMADRTDPAKFKIKMGDWSSTGDVTNIFGYIRAYPDEDVEQVVAHFIKALTESRSRVVGDENIVAVIRTREYVDYILDSGIDVLYEPLVDDLVILYMADRPDFMSPLKAADLPGMSFPSLRNTAINNVRRWLPKVVSDSQLGSGILYYVEGDTMLSTGLVLLDDFWQSIAKRFPGDVLIGLPRKDQLFIFDSEARIPARQLIDATIRENFNLLSPTLYARLNGKIVVAPD